MSNKTKNSTISNNKKKLSKEALKIKKELEYLDMHRNNKGLDENFVNTTQLTYGMLWLTS